jgi:hypothetical protein
MWGGDGDDSLESNTVCALMCRSARIIGREINENKEKKTGRTVAPPSKQLKKEEEEEEEKCTINLLS